MGDWFNQNAPKAAGDKPAGDWFTQNAPKAETPGALARFGHGLYDTTLGPIVQTVSHPIDAAAGLINVPKLEEIAKHIKDGNYGHAALAIGQYATEDPLKRAATQMVNDVGNDVKEGNYAGAGGRVVGDALMLAGPKVLDAAGGAIRSVAPVLKAGAKAAAPDVGMGLATIAGGEALAQVPGMSYPARIALGYPGARQVAAGLKKGVVAGRKVVSDRALAADAAKIPSDVMAELTRESGVPEPPVPQEAPLEVPQGQPIPTPAPRWEDAAALERLQQEQATRAGAPPAAPASAPHVDPSVSPEINSLPPAGTQNGVVSAPVVDSPQIDPQASQFHANGEPKSAAFRGAEKTAQNTTAKAKRFAEQMHAKGVSSQDAADMQGGRVSDAQIQQGAPPRWGNLADYIGENEPKTSVPEIIAELRKLEAAKPAAAEPAAVAKSPRDMTRAELAKQAGLPENATKEQIMKALADAMEEPKAAAAGKGK